MSAREQAQCPKCLEWSPTAWDPFGPGGTTGFADENGNVTFSCPHCGAVVLVEMECEFRTHTCQRPNDGQP